MAPQIAKRSTTVRVKTHPPPKFLMLPLELREQIYAEVLISMPSTLPQLLRTNRQVAEEAQPFLYKQAIAFDGQTDLFAWLQSVDRKQLRHVTTIKFKLHDIEPEKIVGALGERLRRTKVSHTALSSADDNPYLTACDQQVKEIGETFSLMPNVKDFTFLGWKINDPHPCSHMLVSLSHEVAFRFPKLQSLSIQTDILSTTFISSLPHLRSLSITGFSTSTPAETQSNLSSVANLASLSIISPSANLSFEQRLGYAGPLRVQTITPNVLQSLRNLKSLSIYDVQDDAARSPLPRFLTPAFFNALSSLTSLETLRLATNHSGFQIKSVQSFRDYLISSGCSIRKLDLAIPSDFRIMDINSQLPGDKSKSLTDFQAKIQLLDDELSALEEDGVGLSDVRVCTRGEAGKREKKLRNGIKTRLEAMDVAIEWGVWDDWFREVR